MARLFSLSLGTIWRWADSPNMARLLDYARKLDIDGVELTLASQESLYGFRPDAGQVRWMKGLDYVTIHAPFMITSLSYGKADVVMQMGEVQSIYDMVGAKNVIIHPNEMPDAGIMRLFSFRFSIENLHKLAQFPVSGLKRILAENPKAGICIDVSHAYTISRHETARLVKAFKGRITQVHVSGTYRGMDHQSLRGVTRPFLESLEPVRQLDVPVVLEGNITSRNMKLVKDELAFVKDFFG